MWLTGVNKCPWVGVTNMWLKLGSGCLSLVHYKSVVMHDHTKGANAERNAPIPVQTDTVVHGLPKEDQMYWIGDSDQRLLAYTLCD